MPYSIKAECPCCGKKAEKDIKIIEELFGFREMGNGAIIPQSYCRVCRGKRCSPNHKKCISDKKA